MYTSYILSAFAAAGLAAAQCSASGTKTIENAADASALSSCQTFTGSIAIATSVSDDISISGVRSITGDLTVVNAKHLSSLGADSLQSIKGTFKLDKVQTLSTLSFPQLSSVGAIDWNTLPALNGLSFDTGVQLARSVSITDTQLADLAGIDLQTVGSIVLQSNGILTKAELQLTHFTDEMTITANGQDMQLSLPKLRFGKSFTLQNLGELNIPQLGAVNGTFNLQSNTFKSLEAPRLVEVGSTLTLLKNAALAKLELPKLEMVDGGFVIGSNPKLAELSFQQLEKINGNLDFSGNFDTVELPKLTGVAGTFNLQSTGDIKDVCQKFDAEHGKNLAIRGEFHCRSDDSSPKSINGQTSSGSTGGQGNGNEIGGSGATIFPSLLLVGAATGLSALLGLF